MRMERGFAVFVLALVACDGSASVDAGVDAWVTGVDAAHDAGPRLDPATARFVSVQPEGEGPWGLWGFMTIPLDRHRALVLGGTDAGALGGQVFDTVWMVTVGEEGVSAELVEASGPAPRYCGCAAYDPVRDVVVVFGGRDLTGPSLDPETWELAVSERLWTRVEAETQPAGTIGCAMAYAAHAGAIYLFGGAGRSGPTSDTYRYDARSWARLDARGPLARYDGVFVATEDGLLLFGGSYGATGGAFYADLWRFDPTDVSWSEIVLPEESGPRGRRAAWIVRDPERDGLYVGFGYDGMLQPYRDLWYADLEARTWAEIPLPEEGPSPRGFAPALPGGPASLGTLIGGSAARTAVSDAWQLVR